MSRAELEFLRAKKEGKLTPRQELEFLRKQSPLPDHPPLEKKNTSFAEFITGKERTTKQAKETPTLAEVGVSEFLGPRASIPEGLKASMGMLTTFNPEDQIKILMASTPDKITQDVDEKGNIYLNRVEPDGSQKRVLLNRPGISTLDATQIGGQMAAFTPAAQVGGKMATLSGRALTTGALSGATQAGMDILGQGSGRTEEVSVSNIDPGQVIAATAFGGAVPVVFQAGANMIGKLKGAIQRATGSEKPVFNADGTFTDDVIKTIEISGKTPEQLDDLVKQQLSKEGILTPEEIQRFNLFKKHKLEPSRAQITQKADDFQTQQEVIKRSNMLRSQVEGQDVQLAENLETFAQNLGGKAADAFDTGETVFQAITRKMTDYDKLVSGLYQQAREAAPKGKSIQLNELMQKLRQTRGQDTQSGGLISSIKGELKNRGLWGDKGSVKGRLSVNDAEELRQAMNTLYEGANPRARALLRDYKNALDDDVLRVAGEDVYKQARQARTAMGKELDKAKLSKFETETKSLVEKILDGSVDSSQAFEKAIVMKSGTPRELTKLKEFLMSGTEAQKAQGLQAWKNMKAQTVMHLLNKATNTAAKGEGSQLVFNGNMFRKEMERIGDRKLKILFEDNLQFLKETAELGRLRIPVQGTQQGKGPTAQAVGELANKIPVVRELIKFVQTAKEIPKASKAIAPGKETANAMRAINESIRIPPSMAGSVMPARSLAEEFSQFQQGK